MIATRFVIGQAVKRVPSRVEEVGGAVVRRIRAPITALSVTSKGAMADAIPGLAAAAVGVWPCALPPPPWRLLFSAIRRARDELRRGQRRVVRAPGVTRPGKAKGLAVNLELIDGISTRR